MAVPADTYQTYQQIGIREDLSDMIYDLSPTETPVVSNIGKGKASATFVEWQTDVLDTAAHDPHIEGDDTAATAATPTVRYGNYTQIAKKNPLVSGTSQRVDTAGRAEELSYQIAKAVKAVKNNIEATVCGGQGAAAGNATTAREAAGLGVWLADNVVGSATVAALAPGAPTTDRTPGAAAAFTEQDLKDAHVAAWENGGNPDMLVVGGFNKQVASTFTGIATQYRDNPGKAQPVSIIGSADIYVGEFGTINIVPDHFTSNDSAYLIESDMFEVAYLRPMEQKKLAKTGDNEKRQILCEFTLCAKNPVGSAQIGTLTTS